MPLPIFDDPRLPENLRNGLPEWWFAMHSLRPDRTLVEIPRDQWADVLFSRSVGFGLVTQGTDSPHVDEFIFRNGTRPDEEHAQWWARRQRRGRVQHRSIILAFRS